VNLRPGDPILVLCDIRRGRMSGVTIELWQTDAPTPSPSKRSLCRCSPPCITSLIGSRTTEKRPKTLCRERTSRRSRASRHPSKERTFELGCTALCEIRNRHLIVSGDTSIQTGTDLRFLAMAENPAGFGSVGGPFSGYFRAASGDGLKESFSAIPGDHNSEPFLSRVDGCACTLKRVAIVPWHPL
jgi:hypothetical protein